MQTTNIERYRKDLDRLLGLGTSLSLSLLAEHDPKQLDELLVKFLKKKKEGLATPESAPQPSSESPPSFNSHYQIWYSEAKQLIKQMLPERLADFVRYYEAPKNRKEITIANYTLEDCLRGLTVSRGDRVLVGPASGYGIFHQQFNILKSVKQRFESSLFDIQQLVQADLFDSELDAARELAKNKFLRAAGAMVGVVLEKHLAQVASNHSLKQGKKHPGLNDWNQLLKDNDIIDVPKWRFISLLADTRNLCSHNKQQEPKLDQVLELIDGVNKVIKTTF